MRIPKEKKNKEKKKTRVCRRRPDSALFETLGKIPGGKEGRGGEEGGGTDGPLLALRRVGMQATPRFHFSSGHKDSRLTPSALENLLKPLLPPPHLLPPREPRALLQRPHLPPLLDHPLLNLLLGPRLERGEGDVLDVPRVLVPHDALLAVAQDRGEQGGDVGFAAEGGERGEERFEVEDDGAREGKPPQRLPVHAQVHARQGEPRELAEAVALVRVVGRHEDRLVDFEPPGAALDGSRRWQFGEVSGG